MRLLSFRVQGFLHSLRKGLDHYRTISTTPPQAVLSHNLEKAFYFSSTSAKINGFNYFFKLSPFNCWFDLSIQLLNFIIIIMLQKPRFSGSGLYFQIISC